MKFKNTKTTKAHPTPTTTRPAELSVDLLRAVVGGENTREEARK
jgi:hypothetical protein